MTNFLELVAFRKDREGNWKPIRIDGFAKKNDKGGLDVVMFTVPAADNGMVKFVIQKPRDRDNASQGGGNQSREPDTRQDDRGGQRGGGGLPDDEIPFGPEVR